MYIYMYIYIYIYVYIYIYIYIYIKGIQSKPIFEIFQQMPSSVSSKQNFQNKKTTNKFIKHVAVNF